MGYFSTLPGEIPAEPSDFLKTYEFMRTARECDDYEIELIRQGTERLQVGGRGAEISALASIFTKPGDTFHLHWRDRALRLAAGIDLNSMVNCFFGLETENSTDRHLVNHDFDRNQSVYPLITPVSSHCLPTCGVASTHSIASGNNVSICSLGDGSTRQGEFLEAVLYSIEHHLPILWLIIDNQYAISTPTNGRTALDLPIGLSYRIAHGHCIEECACAFYESLNEIRLTSSPRIIRLFVPRLGGHTSHDNQTLYRSKEQITSSISLDPLSHFRYWIVQNQLITDVQLEKLDGQIRDKVRDTYDYANKAWQLKSGDLQISFRSLGTPNEGLSNDNRTDRIADATRSMLDQILTDDYESLLIGEDVEDPLGGVFRLTQGLSTKHKGRVTNSPLAEATILGVAYGRALAGKRTIAEIQFMDFLVPGWNQLVSNICSHHWRTMEKWPLPLIIYTVAGAYSPGEGMFHSHVNASLLARNRDLIVAYPSHAFDVRRVFCNALISEKPTFIMLPKARLWDRQSQLSSPPIAFSSSGRCIGKDVTIVSWGNGVVVAEHAIKLNPAISVELIDLCYLNPLDIDTIRKSVIKTGRLIVIDEDVPEISVGSDLISRIVTHGDCWSHLKNPPRLIARKSQYMTTSEIGERTTLPFPDEIAFEVAEMVKGRAPNNYML